MFNYIKKGFGTVLGGLLACFTVSAALQWLKGKSETEENKDDNSSEEAKGDA